MNNLCCPRNGKQTYFYVLAQSKNHWLKAGKVIELGLLARIPALNGLARSLDSTKEPIPNPVPTGV